MANLTTFPIPTRVLDPTEYPAFKGDQGPGTEWQVSATHLQSRPAGGAWSNVIALSEITGPGGADGKTILSGSGAPSSGTGTNGDYYLDIGETTIYGPKASGAWPAGVQLKGADGVGEGSSGVSSVSGAAPITSTGGASPTIGINAATTAAAGSMSAADKLKLDGIAANAQVNVATNLSQGTRTSTAVPVTSSTGSAATLDVATTTLAGVMSASDKSKLDGVAAGAQVNMAVGTTAGTVAAGDDARFAGIGGGFSPSIRTPAITSNALVLDLNNESHTWHLVTLNANINAGGITLANVPATGVVRVYVEFRQATPLGTLYDISQTAFSGISGLVFDGAWQVYQDETPSIIVLQSVDTVRTWRGNSNAPIETTGTAFDTLAELNAILTDATLDDSSATRTPSVHAASHQSGGDDAIKLDAFATPDDNTNLNATTDRHGLLPKLGGGTTNYLRADGTWANPGASGAGAESGLVLSEATTINGTMSAYFVEATAL
jgi:hypothetical protein